LKGFSNPRMSQSDDFAIEGHLHLIDGARISDAVLAHGVSSPKVMGGEISRRALRVETYWFAGNQRSPACCLSFSALPV
jgi:hypothetical protein